MMNLIIVCNSILITSIKMRLLCVVIMMLLLSVYANVVGTECDRPVLCTYLYGKREMLYKCDCNQCSDNEKATLLTSRIVKYCDTS